MFINKPLSGLVPRRELRPVELLANGHGGWTDRWREKEEEEELHFLSCVQLCWDTTKNSISHPTSSFELEISPVYM